MKVVLIVQGAVMRLVSYILLAVAAPLPVTAYAQSPVEAEATAEAIGKPRAGRVSNPESPRNLLRRALAQAAKSHTAPTAPLLPRSNQLAAIATGAR